MKSTWVAVGSDGVIYATRWNPSRNTADWLGLPYLAVQPGRPITTVGRGPALLDALVIGNDGRIYTSWSEEPIVLRSGFVADWPSTLEGWTELELRPNGTLIFRGRVHDTGGDSYNYRLSAMAVGQQVAVAQLHSGQVEGWILGGSNPRRDDAWNQTTSNPLIAANFPRLRGAQMLLNERYEGTIGSTVEDILGFISRWSLELRIGYVAGIVFLGTELGSLILTGSLVPGARILEGILWVPGPGDALFALAAQGIAEAGSRQRELTQDEYDFAQPVFRGTLPPRSAIVLTDTIGPDTRPFTFPSNTGLITLNMGSPGYGDPRDFDTNLGIGGRGETFIHELTHAWQIENGPMESMFLARAFADRVCEAVGSDPYAVQPGRPFSDYNLEQQAKLVEAWFAKHSAALDGVDATANPRFRYIAQNIRVGTV